MEITEKQFWAQYWGEIKLPNRVDFGFKNDRVIANTLLDNVSISDGRKVALEIGCAPAKWMVFLYEYMHYMVDGFEYLDVAAQKASENLAICNVPSEKSNIIIGDFLSQHPIEKYDLVLSLGFIEHFENYKDVFEKHLSYVNKDGYAAIGFPNFRGINYYVQFVIDRLAGSKILKNHNLKMMDKSLMQKMLSNANVKTVFIDYIGGFEPALFNVQDIKNPFMRIVMKVVIKILSLVFGSCNHGRIASYFMFIVKK